MAFDRKAYDAIHNKQVKKLAAAEKVTKEVLRELSRTTLEAIHATEDVAYINQVVSALTPINRKVAVLFFQEFTGFRVEGAAFTKKDKANYEKAKAAAFKFLEDPLNNIWVWAEREIDIEQKEFDINMVTKQAERMLKKTVDAGLKQEDFIRAILKAGIDTPSLLAVMEEMGIEQA